MYRHLLVPLLLLVAGCPSQPVGPFDWPSGAKLDPAEPVLAYEPAPGAVLDGPYPLDLVWTGAHYAALYGVNDAGHVFLGLSLLDPETGEVVDATRVTDDYQTLEDAPGSAVLVRVYDALTVFWSDGWGNIHGREVATAGGVLQPAPPVQAFAAVAGQVNLAGAVFENNGFTLTWLGDHAPRASQLNGDLGRVGPIVELVPEVPANGSGRITDFQATPSGFAVVWNERTTQRDAVYLIRLHVNGQPDAPILVYEAEDVISAELLVDGSELTAVAFWDLDVASGVVPVVDASRVGEPVFLSNGAYSRPTLDAVGDATYAMLGLAGELRPDNPIETELWFLLVERDTGRIAHELRINEAPADPRCLEGHRIARGHNAFGILWVEGCAEERQLLFARVVPQ